MMTKTKLAISLLIFLAIGLAVGYAAQQIILNFQQEATIAAALIDVYFDDNPVPADYVCVWGIVSQGAIETATLKVVNVGDLAVTILFENVDLPDSWTETWVPDKTTLQPGEEATGILTLTVSETAIPGETYTWNSKITADEVT